MQMMKRFASITRAIAKNELEEILQLVHLRIVPIEKGVLKVG
jgi:hypothetical protein